MLSTLLNSSMSLLISEDQLQLLYHTQTLNYVPENIRIRIKSEATGIFLYAVIQQNYSKMEEEGEETEVATSRTHTFLSKNRKTSYIQDTLRINYLLKTTRGREVS